MATTLLFDLEKKGEGIIWRPTNAKIILKADNQGSIYTTDI